MSNNDHLDWQARPDTGPLEPSNRTALGASLALLGLLLMSSAVFLLLQPLGSPTFGVKFEEGVYPAGSAAEVQSARVGVIGATVLMVVSAGLAASAIAVRPHPALRLIGAVTLLALAPTVLLLLFDYGLAF